MDISDCNQPIPDRQTLPVRFHSLLVRRDFYDPYHQDHELDRLLFVIKAVNQQLMHLAANHAANSDSQRRHLQDELQIDLDQFNHRLLVHHFDQESDDDNGLTDDDPLIALTFLQSLSNNF